MLGLPVAVGLPGPPDSGVYPAEPRVDGSVSIYKVHIKPEDTELPIYVPQENLDKNGTSPESVRWSFQYDDGDIIIVDLFGSQIDLSDLDIDLDLFMDGVLTAYGRQNIPVANFIITDNPDEIISPVVVGLPPPPIGRPVVGIPEVLGEPVPPVVGVPEVVGEPVPPVVGKPIMGTPPPVVGEPVMGTKPPVLGLPEYKGK